MRTYALDNTGERAMVMPEPSLDDIMRRHGSDKSSQASQAWQWPMDYCRRAYEPLLEPMRHEPITMLELGWGEWDPDRLDHSNPYNGGRSAAAWQEYFDHPDTKIHIVDIEAKVNTVGGNVALHQGSQDDPDFLAEVYSHTGKFDLIIDDASHISSKTVAAFKALWPALKPGGLYFVEDLHSSYHDYYFGRMEARRDPSVHGGVTAVSWFKRLADEAFFNGQRLKGPAVDGDPRSWDCFPRRYWMGYAVESVTFHAPQIIVIRKRTEDRYPPDTPAAPKHPR